MDKYLQYNALELSEDPSFRRWTVGESLSGDLDWQSWSESHPDRAEIIATAKTAVIGLKFKTDSIPSETEDKVWLDINDKISGTPSEKTPRRNFLRMISYGAAAAVAAFLVVVNIGGDFDTTVETQMAMLESVSLPDGSVVTLNADSKLRYDKATWKENRRLELEGEAFFEVQKGSKFTVHTQNGDVAVLGTSFNVYSRGAGFNVHCETGRVAVSGSGIKTILTPHQAVAIIDKQHMFDREVKSDENRSTWKTGVFVYKNSTLSEVIDELERQLDLRIEINNNLLELTYTGSFDKSNPQSALSEVLWPLNLKFEKNGKKVIVSK